jgi:hypothetical protein
MMDKPALVSMRIRRQLGIQILEYAVMGALIVGGGAAAVSNLRTGTSTQLNKVATCVQNPSANCS